MRATFATALLASTFFLIHTATALGPKDGQIVRGKYSASGKAAIAGVKVQYQRSNVNVTGNGRIKGRITKVVKSGGKVLSVRKYRISGIVSSLRKRGRTFTAPTRINISDGVKVRGSFQGLVAPDQRLSRYFSGKISGDSNSSFTLRTR